MKKTIILGVSALALLGVSASLFAQTATGGSLITEMKAAIRSFTLAGDLNPGVTSLQSSPVTGKETGDMLTAGEWNRVLELVAQGGGGGTSGGSGWVDVPLNDSVKFDESCQYRAVLTIKNTSAPWVPYLGTTRVAYMTDVDTDHLVYIPHAGIVSHIDYNSKTIYRVDGNGTNPAYTVDKIEKFCGGGGGGGGSTPPIICEKNFSVSAINKTGVTFVAADCGGTLPDNTYIGVLSKYGVPGGEFHPNVINAGETVEGYAGPGFFVWSVTATAGNGYVRIVYIKKTGSGGGGVGGGSSWSDVPLTDTGDFDMACSYRVTLNIANDAISRTWHGSDVIVAKPVSVGPKYLAFLKQDAGYFGIRNTHKNNYGQRNGNTGVYTVSSTVTVTKIEKDC